MSLLKSLQKLFANATQIHVDLLDYLGLRVTDLSSHLFFCGQTGSGKTSLLRLILREYIRLVSLGAVHCCVKADEADWICRLIASTHMRKRLVRLIPGQFTFNVAGYECSREGGTPASLTRLLQRLNDQLHRSTGNHGEQSFWRNLFFDYMHYAATVAWLAHGPRMTLAHLHQIITTSPNTAEEAISPGFQQSPCWTMLKLAEARVQTHGDMRALDRAAEFFLKTQSSLGTKARAAGVQECCSILGVFMLSPFCETFNVAESSFTPEVPLNQYYVVLDAPVLIYQEAGQLSQSLITMMTVDAALRQRNPDNFTLIVRDELQLLIADPLYETLAHSVARSHKLSFWSAVQNLPLLQSSFGGDMKAEQQMKSLLANYVTKFVLANSCMDVTNRFFSTMFGQHKEQFTNYSEQPHARQEPIGIFDAVFGTPNYHFGRSESYADRVPPDRFLHLRRGGAPDYLIDAYMTQGGRVFPETGLPYKLITVSQE